MNKNKLKHLIEILLENVLFEEKEDGAADINTNIKKSDVKEPDVEKSDVLDTKSNNKIDTSITDSNNSSLQSPIDLDNSTEDNKENNDEFKSKPTFGFKPSSFSGSSTSTSIDNSELNSNDKDSSSENEQNMENQTDFEEIIPEDPIKDAVETAINLSKKVGDHQIILNAVKSKMQKNFQDFDETVPIIQALWDTGDPNLKLVARKLLMFTKGE